MGFGIDFEVDSYEFLFPHHSIENISICKFVGLNVSDTWP